jgi:organic radical activating enzyme
MPPGDGRYLVNEVFYSVQGEGARCGEPSVFVRLSRCNMRCAMEPGERSPGGFDCDTEFESGRWLTAGEVVAECMAVAGPCRWVVLTGGEPLLQADPALLAHLHDAGFLVAAETNGSLPTEGLALDWVTVSPKVAEHAVRARKADEVKYVRGHGQALPATTVEALHRFIQPASQGQLIDPRAVAWCVELVKQDPSWRVLPQLHKSWGVR